MGDHPQRSGDSSGVQVPPPGSGVADIVEIRRGETGSLHIDGRNFSHREPAPGAPQALPSAAAPDLTFEKPADPAAQQPIETSRSLIAAGVNPGVVEKLGAADDGRSLYVAPATGAILQPTAPKKAPVPTLRERGPRSPETIEPMASAEAPQPSEDEPRVPMGSSMLGTAIVATAFLVILLLIIFVR